MLFTTSITGDKELDKQLAGLAEKIQHKYLRKAARSAGTVVAKAARKNITRHQKRARRRDENGKLIGLAKSIYLVPSNRWKSAKKLATEGIIGSKVKFRRPMGNHAHLLEYGHRIVPRGKAGESARGSAITRGRVQPYPFLRPARDATGPQVRAQFRTKLAEGLEKETR